ncbi:MAG: hypothetical protein D6732_19895 [Methanobacteriota archaeon]|nr:MAG: hypothetical protein D6732_19895 [Euryarchaeota archaeon]
MSVKNELLKGLFPLYLDLCEPLGNFDRENAVRLGREESEKFLKDKENKTYSMLLKRYKDKNDPMRKAMYEVIDVLINCNDCDKFKSKFEAFSRAVSAEMIQKKTKGWTRQTEKETSPA